MTSAVETTNPTTGTSLSSYPKLANDELERRVQSCHAAFLEWRAQAPGDRAAIIRRIGAALQEQKEKLAQLMTDEMGKLLSQSRQEIDLCTSICDWTADNGPAELEGEDRDLADGKKGRVEFVPIGVIYGIQPWNYPAYQVIRYSISNLMAGNGVLLKHAASVTGTGLLLQQIYREAGLPENLFQALVIDHDQSNDLIDHDLVRGVTLTGSPGAGREIGGRAGRALKKSVLELGANDAYLVLADADIEKAVKICVKGRIYNNGETCIAAKRFVVVKDVFESFRDAFVAAMESLKVGDPRDESSQLGPMAREDLRESLHEQVTESVKKGATLLCGGTIPEGDGYYYPPTVLADVAQGQPAYKDELFGPVASLIRAEDAEDAMRIANDSRFGLGGGIISQDTKSAVEMATRSFDTGMVFINGFGLASPSMPFGGVKDSGFGREHGGFGLKEFVNTKAVLVMG